jgi:shikimate kinase
MILKLKRTPGLYLVGFMASGKSTIGKMLAYELGWNFVDIDADIESSQGKSINEIFDEQGEDNFRRMETEAIRKRVRTIQTGRPMVVALGGGAFAREENFSMLEENGVTIWLDTPLALIRSRLANVSDRPLARDPAYLEHLYFARRAAYERADYRIEVRGDDPAEAVAAILRLPIF